MRWRIPMIAVLAVFVAVSCDQSLPTAAPDEAEVSAPGFKVVENSSDVWAWRVENTCTDEWMSGEFRMHILETRTEDKAGKLHTDFHMHALGSKLVGERTGIVCTGNGPFRESWKWGADDLPLQFTRMHTYFFVCPGPDNDIKAHLLWNIRVNGNGDVTVWREVSRAECLGDGGGGPI